MVCHAGSMVGVEKKVGAKILKYCVILAMGLGLATFLYREGHGNNVVWFRRHKFRVFWVPQLAPSFTPI